MNGAVTASRSALCALAELDDIALATRFLHGVPTNEGRPVEMVHAFAERANGFGRDLARNGVVGGHDDCAVVERTGGVESGLVARYLTREHRIEVFSDTVRLCEQIVDDLGWRHLFPSGCVRAAALEHERAHHLIAADRCRDLRAALGHRVLHIGRFCRFGFVAGADEVAAHAFAAEALGLGRSPLLIATAAAAALAKEN